MTYVSSGDDAEACPPRRRGDDTTALLLRSYAEGAFPMATSRRGRVSFYKADPRSLLPLDDGALTVPRSLRAALRRTTLSFTSDRAFEQVLRLCADVPRPDGGTWINDWIIKHYTRLHQRGHAHSIEAWLTPGPNPLGTAIKPSAEPFAAPVLVGGLYGVHLGGAFFGESMFSRPDLGGTDASKMCLVHLWHHLRRQRFALLDTQIANDHMRRFGIVEIAAADFSTVLAAAIATHADWGTFEPAVTLAGLRI